MYDILLELAAVYILCLSLLGFALMGIDKRKAARNAWRIRERTLILIAFIGGGIGSFLGMYIFHHKTKHTKFVILLPLAAIIYGIIIYQLFKLLYF